MLLHAALSALLIGNGEVLIRLELPFLMTHLHCLSSCWCRPVPSINRCSCDVFIPFFCRKNLCYVTLLGFGYKSMSTLDHQQPFKDLRAGPDASVSNASFGSGLSAGLSKWSLRHSVSSCWFVPVSS